MNILEFKEKVVNSNFSQNYIFEGNESFLKETSNYFINAILNPNNDFKIQKEIDENTHPDLLIIEEEKNNISIEKIRNMIEYVQKRPLISKYKVVIIKNAQFLRKESSNALPAKHNKAKHTQTQYACAGKFWQKHISSEVESEEPNSFIALCSCLFCSPIRLQHQ